MKQDKIIYEYLKGHKEISQREAYRLGVYRLSAVVFEMKRSGIRVFTELRMVNNADGTKSRVAFYRLAEGD